MEGIYKEYNLVIIDTNGKLTMVPKKENEKNHRNLYSTLATMNNEFKDILPDALKDKNISGGFEYANIMAANGYTVIWPSNVNQIDYIVVTMPRLIEPVAVTKIITIINSIKDDKSISSLIAYYKKPRSPKII